MDTGIDGGESKVLARWQRLSDRESMFPNPEIKLLEVRGGQRLEPRQWQVVG
jgi:hypothetical protein